MHQSVMLDEVINSLNLKHGTIIVDATIGGAGHAQEILKRIVPGGRLIGIDADQSALQTAEERLKDFQGSFTLIHDNFKNIDRILTSEGISGVDGIVLDIGLSSYQLEDAARGFSIQRDGRLDMRMDQSLAVSAYDIVNTYNENELSALIEKFGEERFHRRIARCLVQTRSRKPIETTSELAGIIRRVIGYRRGKGKIDPATRTFQALRIAVNDELNVLEEGVKRAIFWLKIGARICVISFHSLEDRIVKHLFRGYAELGILDLVTKKPMRPGRSEVIANPRSRSAKLRVAERIQ